MVSFIPLRPEERFSIQARATELGCPSFLLCSALVKANSKTANECNIKAAPFQWAAIFHKEDINFSHGHHDLEWYDPSTKSIAHKLPCKVRCSFCHSPIMDEGRNMILLFPSLIKFKGVEERDKFKPKCHIFYSQRVIDIPDGLPKWDGLDKQSSLIEDSPPDLVRKYKKEEDQKDDYGDKWWEMGDD
jgi:hypothetical protein